MVLVGHQVGFDGAEDPVQQVRAVDGVGDGLTGGHPGQLGRLHVELEIEQPERRR